VYRQRRTDARGSPVVWLICEIVSWRRNSENARTTRSPRASEAMKSGSPGRSSAVSTGISRGVDIEVPSSPTDGR
jgi:hypothetical protein